VCLSHLELLVRLSKRSHIEVEEYIILLKIRKVVKTSCRAKTEQKEREELYKLRQ